MNVVILAGGLGTRLSEYTKKIPKPMVKINKIPIIIHIINHYAKFGLNNFYIAAGYKKNVITNYFKKKKMDLNIKVIDTGKKTMTGGRLKRLKKYLDNDTFMMTYGDGISDVNIKKLIKFHKSNNVIATLTAVRPPARFGAIKIKGKKVSYFKEKSKLDEGWINGGFFIFEPKVFDFIQNDNTFLEREPLIKLGKLNQLNAYKHEGYWQCMDTIRDKEILEKKFKKKKNINLKKKILILGGTGFIGQNLVNKFTKNKKYHLTTASRSPVHKKNKNNKLNFIKCDLTKISEYKKFDNENFDYIINLSGNIDHKNKKITKKIHNTAAKNIFKYFQKKKIKLFIQVGSSLEYGKISSPQVENLKCKPLSYYGKSKLSSTKFIEKLAKKNKINYLIFRLYQVYGPFQKLDRLVPFTIDNCIKDKTFDCSTGEQYRDFLFINDLTNLFKIIFDKPKIRSGIYNVGSGIPVKVKTIIKLINKITNKGKPNFGGIKMRSDEIKKLYPNIKKIKKTFKWKPKVTLLNGLKKTVKFYEKKKSSS